MLTINDLHNKDLDKDELKEIYIILQICNEDDKLYILNNLSLTNYLLLFHYSINFESRYKIEKFIRLNKNEYFESEFYKISKILNLDINFIIHFYLMLALNKIENN